MKFSIMAGTILVAATLAGLTVARAAEADVALATRAMTQMLAAIAHPDYKAFVAPTTDQFRANVDPKKFPQQAGTIDNKIPLAEPYTVKFLATQKAGGNLGYLFEVTLHNGDQVLAELSLHDGKVSSFHLL